MAFGFGFGFPRRLGSSIWTPARLQTALWLDAADTSTITLNGSNVSQWNDKSGNGRNAVQGTTANQAAFVSNVLNGKPSLQFSPSMTVASGYSVTFNDSVSRIWTLIMVHKPTSVTGTYSNVPQMTDTNANRLGFAQYFGSGGTTGPYLTGSGTAADGGFPVSLNAAIIIGTNAPSGEIYQNGFAGPAFVGNLSSIPTTHVVGSRFSIDANWFRGYIAEYLMIPAALSTADRQLLEGYLAWKWGLVTSLPSNHPYRWDGTVFGYGTLWNPAQITTALWLDAYDPSTITLNGSTVSQWSDKSGNGRNATMLTASLQPAYQGPGLIYLDGTDDTMTYTLSGFTTQGTAIVAFKPDNDTSYALLLNDGSDYVRFTDGYTYPLIFRTARVQQAATVFAANNPQLYEITADSSAPDYKLYRNGTVAYSSSNSFTFGSVPNRVGGSQAFRGWMYEIIIFNYVLSPAERQLIEGYLAWKWGGF